MPQSQEAAAKAPCATLTGDPARVAEVLTQFHEFYRHYVEDSSKQFDKAVEVNKQIAAFHERLLLIDIGTIGLTVTALTSFATRFTLGTAPRHLLVWFIAPAWILLLVSVFFCRIAISNTIIANRLLFEKWNEVVSRYSAQMGMLITARLSQTVSGRLEIDGVERDVSEYLSEDTQKLREAVKMRASGEFEKAFNAATGGERGMRIVSGVAVVTMQIALILLGVSAIKLFLS